MARTLSRPDFARILACFAGAGLLVVGAQSPRRLTSPKEALGFELGADYHLANYAQLSAWWQKLAVESDRMKLVDLGKTEEGRPQYMAILTSPANHKNLARYQSIARKLALAEDLGEDEARALAREGKAVVWIDGGLHGTEVLGAQQLLELVWQMVSRNDPETLRILDDVILLAVVANPDGMDLVSDWYMREKDPLKRSLNRLPRLYQKYIGHDNNRDSYMANMKETANMNRVPYTEWIPQIMYNTNHTAPSGTVMFPPPIRQPLHYHFHPLTMTQLELVSAAMHSRFVAEGKPGTTMRGGGPFSTWFNGGLRTTTYFHNIIGILTETTGSPTPTNIALVPTRQLASTDLPLPIAPQKWHFRQSIEYSITADRAILDVASKHREDFLFNIYRMGKNSIEKGSRDTWTITPKRVEALKAAVAKETGPRNERGSEGEGSMETRQPSAALYKTVLQDPSLRDPRGYILPSDQADFPTATKFINCLIKAGVAVHRATSEFQVQGKRYPAGSWVVKTAQAFRPHVLDMFEPQDHPNDLQYPGGPPVGPYDVAGYTLAFQMGVKFDRILEGFEGPFQKVEGLQAPPPGKITGSSRPAGYLVSHEVNDAFVLTNRLLKEGGSVFWLKEGRPELKAGPGTLFIPERRGTRALLEQAATTLGLNALAVDRRPEGEALRLKPLRIGLWDRFGGSMPSGWTRWTFEQFEFPFEVVYPPTLDAGNLKDRFDVLVFPDGAMPRAGATPGRGEAAAGSEDSLPPEFRGRQGRVTKEKTLPQIKAFLEAGGTVVTLGSSTTLAELLDLGVKPALVERGADGKEKPLPREKYFVPGSVLQAAFDPSHPLAYGMAPLADLFFDNSPTFKLSPEALAKGARPVVWFQSATPLRSGWAWGQGHLEGTVAAVEAPVGKGKLYLIGPEAAFRAQPHGTFKLLLNAIYAGSATPAVPK